MAENPITSPPSSPRRRPLFIAAGLICVALAAAAGWLAAGKKVWTDGVSLRVPADQARIRDVIWTPPAPVGPDFRTPEQEYEPSLSPDGTELYCVRGKPGAGAHIYVSFRRDNAWTAPTPVDAVNSEYDDLGPRITADGRFLLFYSNRPGGLGGYDIWAAPRQGHGWGQPFNLGPSVNSPFNDYSPDPTPDGKRLIFSTNRTAALRAQSSVWKATLRQTDSTDYDLWIANLDETPAATAVPDTQPQTQPAAGAAPRLAFQPAAEIPGINTPYAEGASCMSPAGDFLYFASNRPGGQGKFDIYRSRVQNGVFSAPENLGPSINTADNEMDPCLGMGGYRLYFSTDRGAPAGNYWLLTSDSREVFPQRQGQPLPHLGVSFWIMVISALALLPLLMALRGWGDHRLNVLQKCILISLLFHVLLAFGLSFLVVTQQMPHFIARQLGIEIPVNLGLPKDVEVAMAVRSQAASGLPADAAPAVGTGLQQSQAPLQTLEAPAPFDLSVPQARLPSGGVEIAVAPPRTEPRPAGPQLATPQALAEPPAMDVKLPAPQLLSQPEAQPKLPSLPATLAKAANADPTALAPALAAVSASPAAPSPALPSVAAAPPVRPALPNAVAASPQADPVVAAGPQKVEPAISSSRVQAGPEAAVAAAAPPPAAQRREPADTGSAPAMMEPAAQAAAHPDSGAAGLQAPAPHLTSPLLTGSATPAVQSVSPADAPAVALSRSATLQTAAEAAPSASAADAKGVGGARLGQTSEMSSAAGPQSPALAAGPVRPDASPVAQPAVTNAGASRWRDSMLALAPKVAGPADLASAPQVVTPQTTHLPLAGKPDAPAVAETSTGSARLGVAPAAGRIAAVETAVPRAAAVMQSMARGSGTSPQSGAAALTRFAALRGGPATAPSQIPENPAAGPQVALANTGGSERKHVQEASLSAPAAPEAVGGPTTRPADDQTAGAETHAAISINAEAAGPSSALLTGTHSAAPDVAPHASAIGFPGDLAPAASASLSGAPRPAAGAVATAGAKPIAAPEAMPMAGQGVAAAAASPAVAPGGGPLHAMTVEGAAPSPVASAPTVAGSGSGVAQAAAVPHPASMADAAPGATAAPAAAPANPLPASPALAAAGAAGTRLAGPERAGKPLSHEAVAFAAGPSAHGVDAAVAHGVAVNADPAAPGGSRAGSSNNASAVADPQAARPRSLELAAQTVDPQVALLPLAGALGPGKFTAPDTPFMRSPEQRKPLLKKRGGTAESETAVGRGLAYLSRYQEPDGRWGHVTDDTAPGKRQKQAHDMACTGLATLAFLAQDHTPTKPGPYRDVVARALDYLISEEGADGDLRGPAEVRGGGSDRGNMYDQGIATFALAEAALMTHDQRYVDAAVRGAKFIVAAQNKETGGWRYLAGEPGDTSVFGWQIMALHSTEQLGFAVPGETREGALKYIRICSRDDKKMLTGYQPGGEATPPMTAEMVFCRMLLGQKLTDDDVSQAAEFLGRHPAEAGNPDVYYWYYASLSMLQMQSGGWKDWNQRTRDTLIRMQQREGPSAGAWETGLRWGDRGGRIFTTAMATLTLEVYYRYLPLRTQPPTDSDTPDQDAAPQPTREAIRSDALPQAPPAEPKHEHRRRAPAVEAN